MKKIIMVSIVLILILLLCENFSIVPSTAQDSPQAFVGSTERVSVSSDGRQGNDLSGLSSVPAISADGRYVAFSSNASNLVIGDTNVSIDVFVHDRVSGKTSRVSVASDGTQGNYGSFYATISADGKHVAFVSWADNLIIGDTDENSDVFVHDLSTGETIRVSISTNGTQGDHGVNWPPSISSDGRYVAFSSESNNLVQGDTNGVEDVFVHDLQTGGTTRVSVASDGTLGNYESWKPSISLDGRYIAFTSVATNLIVGDTNNTSDIFVHDRITGVTNRASISSDGIEGNSSSFNNFISGNGRFVAFTSNTTNLVQGDTNGVQDIFVHDQITNETIRISVSSNGTQGNGTSEFSSLSDTGRFVAFYSFASNLVEEDTNEFADIFVCDQLTKETTRVSVTNEGLQANCHSQYNSISATGRYVAFDSCARNLVIGDTNGEIDVFLRDREGLEINYSISGRVTDSEGNPIPGVNIITDHGFSAITDSQGDYTLSGLQSGTYWITTSLSGYFFIPTYRETSVPPERLGVDFSVGFPAFFPIINY